MPASDQKQTNDHLVKVGQCPLCPDSDQKYCSAANDAMCQKRTSSGLSLWY